VSDGANGKAKKPRPRCGALGAKRLYCFIPKSDITTFELAEAQEMLFYATGVAIGKVPPAVCDQVWETMGESSKRHWETKDFPKIVTAEGMNAFRLPEGRG